MAGISDSVRGIFGGGTKIIQTLAMRSGAGETVTIKSVEEILKRVDPLDLERIYIREGMVFNWVNKVVEAFLSSDFRIITSNEKEKRIIENILKNSDFRNLIRTTIQHLLIYGNAFWELMVEGDKIVGFDWVDPKSMDVRRDSSGRIIYDVDGKPVAYVQYVKWNVDISKIPKERQVDQLAMFPISQSGRGILLKREEISHFRYNTVGDSWWGVGIIESIYNIVRAKQNVEEGYAEAVQRVAYPRVWVGVGDETHPPTQEQIDDVWSQLKELETRHQFVSPYYYNPQILESKRVERMAQNLNYFSDQIVAGLGGPKPFITGLGTGTNKATLDDQKILFERNLKSMREQVTEDIIRNAFSAIAKQYRFHSVPSIIWEETTTESLDSKAERLAKYIKAGLLVPDKELRNIIRKIEKLPEESV